MKNNRGQSPSKRFNLIISNLAESAIKINVKELEMVNQEWLVPNFLYKNSLVMVYASAGSGKSWFAYSLCNLLLKACDNKFDKILYLDADNGLTTLKNRNVGLLVANPKFELYATNGAKDFDLFNKLKNYDLNGKIIVIDSIRNFMSRVNLISDSQVMSYLNDLQEMRNKGATIIFLHHQPKQIDGENNKAYKGSTAFADSVDEAYFLSGVKKKGKFILCLEPQKCRDETKTTGFLLQTSELDLKILDEKSARLHTLCDKEKITLELVCEIINSYKNINQSNLAKKLTALANDRAYEIVGKNSLWKLLQSFDEICFKISKDKNQKNFSIL